jgi:outer membrane protein TolC
VDRVSAALAPIPGGLTSDEVARRAVASAPTIEQRRAQLRVTAAGVDRTMAAFMPNVGLTASYTRVNPLDIDFGGDFAQVFAGADGPLLVLPCPGADPVLGPYCVADSAQDPVVAARAEPFEIPVNNYSLQASLSIPLSDYALRLIHAKRGSESETRAGEMARDAEMIRVEQDARLAYYDWLRARAQVSVAEQAVERARARLEDAHVLQQAGTLTDADVLRLDGIVWPRRTST